MLLSFIHSRHHGHNAKMLKGWFFLKKKKCYVQTTELHTTAASYLYGVNRPLDASHALCRFS